MIDVGNIYLTESELEKCREFSLVSARSQQAIEFGQRTTKARSVNEIARDNLIGKIAEICYRSRSDIIGLRKLNLLRRYTKRVTKKCIIVAA